MMAKLTAKRRKRLKASTFGIPSERKYPMNDITHARLAVAMSAAHETPAVARKVALKAKKRFPSIQVASLKRKRRRK